MTDEPTKSRKIERVRFENHAGERPIPGEFDRKDFRTIRLALSLAVEGDSGRFRELYVRLEGY